MKKQTSSANEAYANLASDYRTNHILYGDDGRGNHLYPGNPGKEKTLFPKDWSAEKVMHEVSDIATAPTVEWVYDRTVKGVDRYAAIAVRDGVEVRVVTDGSDIITAFPTRPTRK